MVSNPGFTALLFLAKTGNTIIPQKYKRRLKLFTTKAGFIATPYFAFGMMFYASIALSILSYLFYIIPNVSGIFLIITTILAIPILPVMFFTVIYLIFYFYLNAKIYARTKEVEAIFPEYLTLVSQNLKGGVAFERALWLAVSPDFKILKEEMYIVAKKVTTGQSLEEAVLEFSEKYNSLTVKNSFILITEGIKGGGKISYIIDQIVKEIESTSQLKKELTASNLTYVIFMWVVVFGIAPFILNIALLFLGLLSNFSGSGVSGTEQVGGAFGAISSTVSSLGEAEIDFNFFKNISRGILLVVSFFCALMVSLINTGSLFGTVRNLPIFLVGSQVAYIVINYFATIIFGSLI